MFSVILAEMSQPIYLMATLLPSMTTCLSTASSELVMDNGRCDRIQSDCDSIPSVDPGPARDAKRISSAKSSFWVGCPNLTKAF